MVIICVDDGAAPALVLRRGGAGGTVAGSTPLPDGGLGYAALVTMSVGCGGGDENTLPLVAFNNGLSALGTNAPELAVPDNAVLALSRKLPAAPVTVLAGDMRPLALLAAALDVARS